MSKEDDLRSRLKSIEGESVTKAAVGADRRGGSLKTVAAIAGALALMLGGYIAYDVLQGPRDVAAVLPTSQSAEFPDDRDLGDTLELPARPDPIVIERAVVREVADSEALKRIEELESELARISAARAASENETENERALRLRLEEERALREAELESLRVAAQNDEERMKASFGAMETEIASLRSSLDAAERLAERERIEADSAAQRERSELLRQLTQSEQAAARELARVRGEYEARLREAEGVDQAEIDRLAEERKRQELAAAQRAARVNSELVALNNSSSEEAGSREPRELSLQESFVRRRVEPVPVSSAQIIHNPEATVIQGTIIQAALEVSIDSSLPGQIRAVVSEDVFSLDGSRVLIPAGSKVIGEYSNGIKTGQRRVLIAWTRIVTTDNRSVNIASYGADRLGRSGTEGAVDTHFAARFGGAALISIISAAPAIVAGNADNEDTQNAIADVGDDFSGETRRAMSDVLSVAPTIYVAQGSQVSIIVDRDLEIS